MKPSYDLSQRHPPLPYILLGAGGHAKVIIEILQNDGVEIAGLISPEAPQDSYFSALSYLGDDSYLSSVAIPNFYFVNCLGSTGNTLPRTHLFQRYKSHSGVFPKIIHPLAVISNSAEIGEGCHVLAGAIIGPSTRIGSNVIINHQSLVEHDCCIGENSHIASSATLCGNVKVGKNVHIGAGATINQGVHIGDFSTIASGAVVIHDIPKNCLAAGIPAKVKKSNDFAGQNE